MLVARREQAAGDIVDEGGLEAALELVSSVEVSHIVGWALGGSRPVFDDALLDSLESDQPSELLLGEQYFARRFRDGGWSWLDDLIGRHAELSSAQRARLLLATREFPRSWETAAEHPDVEEFFWRHFSPFGLGADFEGIRLVATNMMRVRRYAAALKFLGIYLVRRNDSDHLELILEGLEGLLGAQDDEEIRALGGHDFASLFELLDQNRAVLDVSRLATLQWAYLPILGHGAKVETLSGQLATIPELFVDVVCLVYRRHDGGEEEHPPAKGSNAAATTAYRLLTKWSQPPGFTNGAMDAGALGVWLDTVEPLLRERDRLEAGLQHVGQVLASTPADVDGTWPGEAVRETLEDRHDEHIEMGLYLAVLNGRGVTMRGLTEGGRQEKELAEKFRADATRVVDAAPRSAALLRRIASNYSIDARREEDDAERFRRGLA